MAAGGPDLALRRMLSARSVAIVGASARQGSVGERCLIELRKGGYAGRVVPVNPKYERLGELRCVPRIAEAGPVDVAVLAVPNALLEEQLAAAIAAGAGSAVVFASAHEESDDGRAPLAERLGALARGAGIPICGPNGMGFLNVEEGLRVCGFSQPPGIRRGGLTFISHSGSAFSALLHNDRGLGFNLVVSSGLEVTTTASDYLRHALALPSTRVVALFLEVVRDPIGFRDALEQAAQADIPVVVLKVGREERTRELVRAHSGALAGEDGAYEALFDAFGVARVESLDELADTCELLLAGRRAGPGALATAHDSGGERAMLADAAAREGVPLATIGDATRERLTALLDPGLTAENPLDLWGTGRGTEESIPACLGALADDPAVAAVAFAVDLTTEEDPSMGYTAAAIRAAGATRKPFAVLANFAGGVDRRDATTVRRAGVPVLEGTRTGLAAFRHLFARRDALALPPVAGASPVAEAKRLRWRERLADDRPLDEVDGLALAADYGIDVAACQRASSAEAAVAAAARVGYPVAVKTAAAAHKSDVGGVVLGANDAEAVRAAYARIARLGPVVTVARMAPPGVELALGVARDATFGPLVVVAAGGVLVETLRDRRLAFPPLDGGRAARLVDRLAIRPVLDGARGAPPADLGSLVRAIVGLSWIAADLGDLLEGFDLNPVLASPAGAVAVDALVVRRADAGSGPAA